MDAWYKHLNHHITTATLGMTYPNKVLRVNTELTLVLPYIVPLYNPITFDMFFSESTLSCSP